MQVIRNWFAGNKNFHVGKVLYETFGPDENVKKLLNTGKSNFTQQLLEKHLLLVLSKPAPAPIRSEVALMPESNDSVLKALKAEWMEPYQQMNFKRHALHKFGNTNTNQAINERKQLAFDILELEQQCMLIWEKRDYYLQHGKLPDAKKETAFNIPTDPVELGKTIEATKRRIRDWRNKLTTNPSNAKGASELQKYRAKYVALTGNEYNENQSV